MAALARGAVCLSLQEVSAANSAFLSGTLQRAVKAVFAQYVVELALALKLRQGVVATAVAYLRRFYARCSFQTHDPRHVAPACLFLAAKVEESPVASKALLEAVSAHWSAEGPGDEALQQAYSLDEATLNQKELVVIEVLEFGLIVEHPYEHLETLLAGDASLSRHAVRCFTLVNDTYRVTDLLLLQPPQVVAVACVVLAAEVAAPDVPSFAQRLPGVSPDAVLLAAAELLRGYERPRMDARACEMALAADD